jgi:hypothetical protein
MRLIVVASVLLSLLLTASHASHKSNHYRHFLPTCGTMSDPNGNCG